MTPSLDGPLARRIDAAAASAAVRLRGRGVDRAAYALSQAANHSMVWHAINAADALTGDATRRRRAIRRSVIVAVEQAVVNGPVKALVGRERPDERTDHPHTLRTPRSSSFPSGHASAAACSATLLSRDLGHTPLWWSLAGAISWSRIHVGVHHGTDVVAGLLVGRTLASGAATIWPSPGRGTATR